jgi:hypothetical protein
VVLFVPQKEGPFSLHLALFFSAVFLKNIFHALLHADTCQSSLLCFWMGSTARHIYRASTPYLHGSFALSAVIQRIGYVQEPVYQNAQLSDQNIVTLTNRLAHRAVYQHWLLPLYRLVITKESHSELDWDSIWRQTIKLPRFSGETMYLFSQPTTTNRSQMPSPLNIN